MLKEIMTKVQGSYENSCCKLAAFFKTSQCIQLSLMLLGVGLIVGGAVVGADAQYTARGNFNDARIAESADLVLTYLNGSFGALIMVASGVGAVISGAFGQYKAALGLLVVAIGSFIVRSLISTWFNDTSMQSK
jgi:hypothetical protein